MTNEIEVVSEEAKPLVSFVLLAFNQNGFIREAMESAFSQTYEPLEIIISDDASQDGTFALIEEIAAEYTGPHKIILNRNVQNMGIGPHVEYAVGLSNGAYVVMAGGDDISMPERVAQSMDVILRHGELGGVFGRYHEFFGEFSDTGEWMPSHAVDGRVVSGKSTEWLESKKGKAIGMPGSTAMWNRKLFDLFSPMPSGVLAEDVVLGSRAFISGLGIGFTSAEMVKYRIHDANSYSGVGKELFERRAFFSRAVVQRDVLEFRRKFPDQYSEERWERMIRFVETMLFRATVISRRPVVGKVWSRLLFLIGFRN